MIEAARVCVNTLAGAFVARHCKEKTEGGREERMNQVDEDENTVRECAVPELERRSKYVVGTELCFVILCPLGQPTALRCLLPLPTLPPVRVVSISSA